VLVANENAIEARFSNGVLLKYIEAVTSSYPPLIVIMRLFVNLL
jgi:hypothetical protein